ncbi:MAG: colicin V production protein [Microbacterium sp. SCN 70-200]|mgnify:CR=1 FL=1|uniref:MarP family serine protease n=1 Tax=unclassified Microbacterium TaxID=2609290 RepID=UPI00086AD30D|nr:MULTISPECIES: MarP family serine protease [unclassified Microbacterium]MBN9213272.1 MarP family serine protease [Microbacterium sp.]ODT40665.1 MAG: colicin V production protein [Microbacterium sp. SCN 70-200]OJV83662.1 MAG: serine protease [Microbacterium sp. 70-16]
MLVVDIVVVAALIVAFAVGLSRGFVASLGTIVGLVAGGFAAVWLVPLLTAALADAAPDLTWRPALSAAAAVLLVVGGAAIGSAIGAALRRGVDRAKLSVIDRGLGAVVGTVATALVLLMAGQAVVATGTPGLSTAIASSRVLRWVDDLTPEPVDSALAQVRGLVLDEGLPTLGELLEIQTTTTSPPVALDDPALQTAAASVARISGTAYACGVSMTGSGFVVADDLLVTNAHVVAGITQALVELPGRTAREGRVVYFDPVDDIALVAVDGLDAAALPLNDDLAPGDAAVVQGYPYGGPFTSMSAAVLSRGTVAVPDIYDASSAPREIFALQADVAPGNSGGPLLTSDGEAGGIVFARGEDGAGRGYAITIAELEPALQATTAGSATVSTGSCTS